MASFTPRSVKLICSTLDEFTFMGEQLATAADAGPLSDLYMMPQLDAEAIQSGITFQGLSDSVSPTDFSTADIGSPAYAGPEKPTGEDIQITIQLEDPK